MIKILKEGEITKITKFIYLAIESNKCSKCGCEFEFEAEDAFYIEKTIYGKIGIKCPCCENNMYIPKISLRHREEEVEVN